MYTAVKRSVLTRVLTGFFIVVFACSVTLVPIHTAEAFGGGGGGGGLVSFVVSIVMTVALAYMGVPMLDFTSLVSSGLNLSFTEILTTLVAGEFPSGLLVDAIINSVATSIGSNIVGAIMTDGTQGFITDNGIKLYIITSPLSEIAVGGSATLSGTITNSGGDLSQGFTSKFQIFGDSVIINSSRDLASPPLFVYTSGGIASGTSVPVSTSWSVPSTFSPGEYFLRLCVNTGDVAQETNYDNNCGDIVPFTIIAAIARGEGSQGVVAVSSQRMGSVMSSMWGAVAHATEIPDFTAGTPSIYPAPTSSFKIVSCQAGYKLVQGTGMCIPNDKVSCASIGFPNVVCDSGHECVQGVGNNRFIAVCQTVDPAKAPRCDARANSVCISSVNACGMTRNAAYQCDGSCPAVAPSNVECTAVVSISAEPLRVKPNTATTITWSANYATKCSISGPGISPNITSFSSAPTTKSVMVSTQSTFKISCTGRDGLPQVASVLVNVTSFFQEY